MKRGFTLIELLIVVIIVGILATVALPQYTKVVQKTRGAEAVSMLGSIRTGQTLYYAEKGVFTITMSDLLVEPPSSGKWDYYLDQDTAEGGDLTGYVWALAEMEDLYITLKINYDGSTLWGPPGPTGKVLADKHPGTPSN